MYEIKTQKDFTEIVKKAQRKPRFSRDPKELESSFVITHRDIEILQHVKNARVISSDQIRALVMAKKLEDRRVGQAIVRRLGRLFHQGLLDRPRHQQYFQFPNGSYAGSKPIVYALGQKGADLLGPDENDTSLVQNQWQKKNREIGPLFLEHSLMVSEIYLALHIFLSSTPNLKLSHWSLGEDAKDAFYLDDDKNVITNSAHEGKLQRSQRCLINPDAYFSLRRTDTHEAMHFLIEADRSTESLKRFLDKIQSYYHWQRHSLHSKKLNVKSLIILTTTKSVDRLNNLKTAAQSILSPQASQAFRFTCERFYQKDPILFRKKIWLIPHGTRAISIFE